MHRLYILVLFLATSVMVQAQVLEDEILFTVEGTPVYAKEFVRVFNKNLDLVQDESQKDVEAYLQLFVNYKLKLKEAEALGLNQKAAYKKELEGYKKQLAKNYMSDSKVTNQLIEEAYQRMANEVKASHILIRLNQDASPEDTLNVYNRLVKLRERVQAEGFNKVKNDVHDGQTVFAEDLGYFSGFKMVYKFENAAYNTPVGEISMPFKTRFGYHIVKVYDKRKSRGERTVAHIMVANKNADKSTNADVKNRINDIYQKLQQGEDFETLAKQFSEDKGSATQGGKLPPFESGQLSSSKFEDVAFGLQEQGDLSKPFETEFGWHIVKLYKKTPIKPFEVLQPELEEKVKRDSRSNLINEALIAKLKQEYNIEDNTAALTYFTTILNTSYFKGMWQLPKDFPSEKPLVKIGDLQLTYSDFGEYLVRTQRRPTPEKPLTTLVTQNYEAFLGSHLMQYREANLEDVNEEYAHIIEEYRDGLLLFDLMETTIWQAAKEDSLGLEKFYQDHKATYYWNTRVNADVASSPNKQIVKKAAKMLRKGETTDTIKEALNKNDQVNIMFTSGILEVGHQALPEALTLEKGISNIYQKDDTFLVVNVKEVFPKTTKALADVRGMVLTDFQNYKEQKFIEKLHKKYAVTIDQAVLNQIKSQINK
ncbi:MAG: peptidylprolyl isomerase [Algicola sp.]|nr:peptidylprolyl isomerase [Algicola sp.]